jgi:gamma-glutamyl-gamma-aminobutyrate hydrolase PuuD
MGKHNLKAFAADGGYNLVGWFTNYQTMQMDQADIAVFPGGADISPSLYNRKPHSATAPNPATDAREVPMFKRAVELGLPIVGICRGAQLACALAGGELVQNQYQPYEHEIQTPFGKDVNVLSIHHQAMYPWDIPYDDWEIYGWSEKISSFHHDADCKEMVDGHPKARGRELEIVYFRKIKCLAIQSHPEMTRKNSQEVEYCRFLVSQLIKGAL